MITLFMCRYLNENSMNYDWNHELMTLEMAILLKCICIF